MNYVPLHVHSDASPDGAGTVASLVAEASRLGMSHLALTDHGTLGNAVAFWTACLDRDIVPILGMEAYLQYNGKRHHLTLLSQSQEGFNNLIALDTYSHSDGFSSGYPLITLDDIHRHRAGLFALTGCASSPLYEGDENAALQFAGDLIDSLGRENVGAELQFLGTHNTWSRPIDLVKKMGLLPYVTNDTHYPCRQQFPAHQCITKARRGFTYDSQHLWLKSHAEIVHEGSKFTAEATVLAALDNTLYWAQTQYQPFDLLSKPTLPKIPKVKVTLFGKLEEALLEDLKWHKWERDIRIARFRKEWDILSSKGFLDYVYILWDIVKFAKERGIAVGPGRGSGGGSYLLYLLEITDIDPIRFNLLFERFINPQRSDYPDVDVDFESDRRGEVIEYANTRWGAVPIATYSCYSHKSAVHDIARTLAIPQEVEIPASEGSLDSEEMETFLNYKPDARITYNTMLGQIRHRSKHAAGVVIASRPLPIERSGDNLVVAWAEGMNTKDLSKAGIVKFDLLGLTSLSQLGMMAELTGDGPDPDAVDDPAIYDLFCKGDVSGIFQWTGSEGIRDLTVSVQPKNFTDLTTCNALYRPGALDAGTAKHYPEFMKSPRLLHPRLDPILASTYGVLCYQEQVMEVVATVTGGDLAEADLARRLLSKADVGNPKWEKQIAELQKDFYSKGKVNGFDEPLLRQLWSEIYTHSGYSYNLSHASAYTLISYRMAWYKVYHRPAFIASVLQYDKENAQTYILDAIENGISVRPPNINKSTDRYVLDAVNGIIYLPLTDVSFLGENAVAAILEERKLNGQFQSYEDFNARVTRRKVNNRARSSLELIGGFDLPGDPSTAIDGYAELEIGDKYETQLKVMGYVIPSKAVYAAIKNLRDKPAPKGFTRYAGFISKAEKKKSKHGEYTSFTLSPSGSFWMRAPVNPLLTVGRFVSGTKSSFGSSNNAKAYKL